MPCNGLVSVVGIHSGSGNDFDVSRVHRSLRLGDIVTTGGFCHSLIAGHAEGAHRTTTVISLCDGDHTRGIAADVAGSSVENQLGEKL